MSGPDLERRVAELEATQRQLLARLASLEAATGLFADDKDLASSKGDPTVKFVPRAWRGANMANRRYSQCSPEFLDVLAGFLAWSADNPREGKEKYAANDRRDAARARSWARRVRAGWRPAQGDVGDFPGDAAPSFDAPPPHDPTTGEVFDDLPPDDAPPPDQFVDEPF